MQILLQTKVSSPSIIYDTNAPAQQGKGLVGKLIGLFNPYVRVQQGSTALYEYGKSYPDESAKWQGIVAAGAAIAIVGTGALIFGLGRLSK